MCNALACSILFVITTLLSPSIPSFPSFVLFDIMSDSKALFWIGAGWCLPNNDGDYPILPFMLDFYKWVIRASNVSQSEAVAAAMFIFNYDNNPLDAVDMVKYFLVQSGNYDSAVDLLY